MHTNHGVVHDIALGHPLRHIQGPCDDIHIIIAPGQSLDKTLKACPVVPALQARTTSAQTVPPIYLNLEWLQYIVAAV